MRKSVYYEGFIYLVRYLSKNCSFIDSGYDWFRVVSSNISSEIIDLFDRLNSTTGPDLFISNEYFNGITLTKSSVGPGLLLKKKVELKNGIVDDYSIIRIVRNEKNNTYLIDFYGLYFGLQKNYASQILSIQDYLNYLGVESFRVSRVDFNYNFHFSSSVSSLHQILLEKFDYRNYVDYKSESFAYGLWQQKGRNSSGKPVYRLTKSFGFRVYDKNKNVVDLGLQQVYSQYLIPTVRVELVCGSEVFSKSFNSFNDFDFYFKELLSSGGLSVEKRQVRDKENMQLVSDYSISSLHRKKIDLQSRLYNYVKIGGSLKDVLLQYHIDSDYIDYLLSSNYLKAFALIEKEIEKKLENSDKKNKQVLKRIKNKLLEYKILLSNLDDVI